MKLSEGSLDSTQLLPIDSSVIGPKFLAYQEGEDIAAFITRFEIIAMLLEVREDTVAVRLGSLLTGKAAKLYSNPDTITISDLALLRHALLIGFDKTGELQARLQNQQDAVQRKLQTALYATKADVRFLA